MYNVLNVYCLDNKIRFSKREKSQINDIFLLCQDAFLIYKINNT